MSSRRGTAARDIETVDLTLSSPSPEPPRASRPQLQHQPSAQLERPTPFRGEHRPSPNTATAGPSHRTVGADFPVPRISQHHLRNIINTAPQHELKNLLLELCASSPALSGAVVRGLAPHSTWARDTIRDYQERKLRAQVRVKPEHASSSSAGLATSSYGRHGYGQSSTPRSTAIVKPGFDLLDSDSDHSLDDLEMLLNPLTHPKTPARSYRESLATPSNGMLSDLRVPSWKHNRSSNVLSTAVAGPSSSNQRTADGQNFRQDREPQTGGEPPLSFRVKSESIPALRLCIQCEEEASPRSHCHFHAGKRKTVKQGTKTVRIWECCSQPLNSIGCCEGEHMFMRTLDSPDSFTPTSSKKPKLI